MSGRVLRPLPAPIVFLLFFSFATAAALLFQKFLLPLAAGLHHGQGLVQGDSAYFHSIAVDLAERIRQHGWSEWRPYPTPSADGNVALLAALYVLFGVDPSLMVPVNAALHALTGTLLFLMGRMLWQGRVGTLVGMIAGTLYVVFPSSLNWYGQIHKDGFAIAGTALILYAWIAAESGWTGRREAAAAILTTLAGVGLIVFVRPYHLTVVIGGALVMLLAKLLPLRGQGKPASVRRTLALQAVLLATMVASVQLAPRTGAGEQSYSQWNKTEQPAGVLGREALAWQWQRTPWIPSFVENYVEVMARTRVGLIDTGVNYYQAGSLYDADVLPASTPAVAAYAPRALQIALFAPFPSLWFEKLSATRMVAVGETAVWYLIAPGLLLALLLARSRAVVALVAFALAILTLYGITIANVGTLYRVRYLYLFLLALVGLAGWFRLLERRGLLPSEAAEEAPRTPAAAAGETRQARAALVGSGLTVAAITAVTFVGLFIRDIIMARQFGLGVELDAFVAATLAPMLLVGVISVPIGTAIVPVFLAVREEKSLDHALALARRVGFLFMGVALALAAVLFVAGPWLLEKAGWAAVPEKAARVQAISVWIIAIFLFSGLVTLANGLLNALGHFRVPAAAQAIVPLVTIAALLAFGASHGALAAAVAMFAGQLINLAVVHRALAVRGVSLLRTSAAAPAGVGRFIAQYLPLVAAAVFMQLTVPVSTAMASALPEGSVAALGLGSKAVLFVTGLVGAAIASVVLPYFSQHMAQNRLLDARRELSFLLLAGTVVSIPATLALHLLAEPFVRLVFEGGAFGSAEAGLVSRVMAYGVLQLPFFVINILLLKFAIATRHSGRVMLASLVGLAANVLLNLVLMDRIGAPGIALSMTLAAAVSAGLMLLFCRMGDVAWVDMVFIVMNWVLYLALAVCLHYASYAGAIAAFLAFCFLLLGEWAVTFGGRNAHGSLP